LRRPRRAAYHGPEAHDALSRPPCVSCYTVHARGGDGMAYYMARERVAAECRVCHPDEGAPTVSPEPSYAGSR
jgi:hypothetical protein